MVGKRGLLSNLLVSWGEVARGFRSLPIVEKLVVCRCASYICLADDIVRNLVRGNAKKKVRNRRFVFDAAHVSDIQGPVEVDLRFIALNGLGLLWREKFAIIMRSELQGNQVDIFIALGFQLLAVVQIAFRGFRNRLRKFCHVMSLRGAFRSGRPFDQEILDLVHHYSIIWDLICRLSEIYVVL